MDYQLVLQFNGDSLSDFDAMVNLEQELSVELKDIAEVDGHDMGCGEINIFMIASNPVAAFEKVKSVLKRHGLLAEVKSAFRSLSEDGYTTIWPENSTLEFSVA